MKLINESLVEEALITASYWNTKGEDAEHALLLTRLADAVSTLETRLEEAEVLIDTIENEVGHCGHCYTRGCNCAMPLITEYKLKKK